MYGAKEGVGRWWWINTRKAKVCLKGKLCICKYTIVVLKVWFITEMDYFEKYIRILEMD
mgnify:CR=1 FL=1